MAIPELGSAGTWTSTVPSMVAFVLSAVGFGDSGGPGMNHKEVEPKLTSSRREDQ